MKNHSYQQKTPQEIASDIFNGTKVESAYDKKGRFSHLLARLPKDEFFALYSQKTTATIFIHGHWLQLSLQGKQNKVLNRATNVSLDLVCYLNETSQCILEFLHSGRRILRVKLKSMGMNDLLETSEGYYVIARTAVRAFERIMNSNLFNKSLAKNLPIVQILPEEEDDDFYFDSSLVNLI